MRRLAILLSICVAMCCCVSCADAAPSSPHGDLPLTLTYVTPENGSSVSLANAVVAEINEDYTVGKTKEYADGTDRYENRDVVLEWDGAEKAEAYRVRLSTRSDFSDAKEYVTDTERLVLSDLFVSTEYYWKIEIETDGAVRRSRVYRFTTSRAPRTVQVDGISNTRDIGGYHTVGGKRVRQGLVYRGAKPEAITESGRSKLRDAFGIKTQLDLRGAMAQAVFDRDVRFVPIAGLHYLDNDMGIHDVAYREILASEIRVFADRENYPIFFHCNAGRDRTGTLAMLIEALLGVSEADICLDYEMSMLSAAGTGDTISFNTLLYGKFMPTLQFIKEYGDGSLQKNCEKFLTDSGVTAEEIASIRNILLG